MKFKSLIAIASATILFASCLKSTDDFGWDDDPGSVVVEIRDAAEDGGEKVISLEAAPPTETFDLITIRVNAARGAQPSGDITVDLVPIIPGAYTPLPAGSYTIPSLKVVIPKGQTEVSVPITLNKSVLDLTKSYGLGFQISSTTEGVISELANKIIVGLLIKNQYDADYTVTGYFFHPTAGRAINMTKHMFTLGANTVEGQVGDLAGFYFAFDVNGTVLSNWRGLGSAPPAPASGFMTADNPGNFSHAPLSVGPPYIHANYPNTYDPATKTFLLHYGYHVGGNGQNTFTRQIYEKWVRI